ncbi:hypothetical protein AK830_g5239 [Neonectria ditissima]|uniref:Glycosyltransferase family 28 N-terminal domain-containing protein n=1 Tax=Neonectria ditissima TaxID=78410 RepID=A0A0P7BLA6_9HYPO|nr:hypothetical protein AK830_g5239 [Neonectria ditissima]
MRIVTNFAAAVAVAVPAANAILVAPSSPCSSDCGNVLDATTPDDIVCSQDSYTSGAGQVFEGCVECEISSDYSHDGETDQQWMLYNLRYAVSYCLFGTPDNSDVITTPCITTYVSPVLSLCRGRALTLRSKACGPFKNAIEFKNMSSDIDSYDYCALWPVTDTTDLEGCKECLRAGSQEYLANFVTVLQAGCEQQPDAGTTVGIEGSIFSDQVANVTEPSAAASIDPDWFDDGPINLGAKVGIAIGGLVFVLTILGCGIVWNGKRRRRSFLRQLETKHGHEGWPAPHPTGETHDTPLSQRPLRGWDDSPMSATTTEKTYPRYFSPYSSQYNSPVSAQDGGPSMQWPGAAHAANTPLSPSAVFALNAELSNQWDPSHADASRRQGSAETYEMHEVDSAGSASASTSAADRSFRARMQARQGEPPVLGHPGFGRSENSPPRTYPVAEDDARPGFASFISYRQPAMAPPKILMVVASELGHANVFLAAAQALLEQAPDVELHLASFAGLKPTIDQAFVHVKDANVAFHPLPGPSVSETVNRDPEPANRMLDTALLKPGFRNTPAATRFFLTRIFLSWTADEYVAIFDETNALIEALAPDVFVVDGLLSPVLTAAKNYHAKVNTKGDVPAPFKLVLLSPNSIKDLAHHLEPPKNLIAKWPITGAAMLMPIPWYLVPLNFYFLLRLIFTLVTDKHVPAQVASIRAKTGLPELDVSTFASIVQDGLKNIDAVLLSSRLEVDFPTLDLANAPRAYMDKLVGCGPILRAAAPLAESDASLAEWLKGGPVVTINLGTVCQVSQDEAVEMARALRQLLDEGARRGGNWSEMRILWKLKKDPGRGPEYHAGPGSALSDVLGAEIEAGRVRIMDWIVAEPNSILNTGDVVCSVTHGGASSFFDSLTAGVPQVVLPVWADTFDYANRAEMLGIGRWGNVKGCPRWTTAELAPVLVEVVLDRNAEFAAKSRVLAQVCRQGGGGRNVAARKILEIAGSLSA